MAILSVAIKNSVIFLLCVVLVHALMKRVLANDISDVHNVHNVHVNNVHGVHGDHNVNDVHDVQHDVQHTGPHIDTMNVLVDNTCSSTVTKQTDNVQKSTDAKDLLEYVFGSVSRAVSRCNSLVPSRSTSPRASPKKLFATRRDDDGNHMVISSYKNEKPLNGGEVSPGIFAFNGNCGSFAALA